MNTLIRFSWDTLSGAWLVLGRMAPFLLLGFLVAGLFSVWLSPRWVARHLHGRARWAPVKAALFGVPLPLCSCGVIPVTAALRRHGAGRGATAAFLMSTPQTGVDSIAATWGLLGPLLAVFRPIAAFVSGAVCGLLVDRFAPERSEDLTAKSDAPGNGIEDTSGGPWWRRALWHGFVTLPGDIHRAVLIGIVVSAVLGALFPPGFLADHIGRGFGSMLTMLLLGIPLYVCSTGSIPIALGLMHAGVTPGAALVFLITGPATNAAALATLVRLLGARASVIYLATLVATALASALLLDRWLIPALPSAVCHAEMAALGPWGQAAAVALLTVLVAPFFRQPAVRRVAGSIPADETVELKVRGMSCAHCAGTVERALVSVSGVASATVRLQTGCALVRGHGLSREALRRAVESAGYTAD